MREGRGDREKSEKVKGREREMRAAPHLPDYSFKAWGGRVAQWQEGASVKRARRSERNGSWRKRNGG